MAGCCGGFFHPVAQFLADTGGDLQLQEFAAPLAKAFDRLQRATLKIAGARPAEPRRGRRRRV